MPSERSITTRLVPICSQKPCWSTKRNRSTASWPRGSGGMSSVYSVLSPIHRSSARTLS